MSSDRISRSGEQNSGASPGNSGSGQGKSQGRQTASPWEWATAALSTLLVLGAMGFMLYEALTEPRTPPEITIEAEQITPTVSGYVVQFSVRNSGYTTARALMVEGELTDATGTIEKAQVTLDYVPPDAVRKGGLFFSRDPRHYQLTINPKGYDEP